MCLCVFLTYSKCSHSETVTSESKLAAAVVQCVKRKAFRCLLFGDLLCRVAAMTEQH